VAFSEPIGGSAPVYDVTRQYVTYSAVPKAPVLPRLRGRSDPPGHHALSRVVHRCAQLCGNDPPRRVRSYSRARSSCPSPAPGRWIEALSPSYTELFSGSLSRLRPPAKGTREFHGEPVTDDILAPRHDPSPTVGVPGGAGTPRAAIPPLPVKRYCLHATGSRSGGPGETLAQRGSRDSTLASAGHPGIPVEPLRCKRGNRPELPSASRPSLVLESSAQRERFTRNVGRRGALRADGRCESGRRASIDGGTNDARET
jgi:hypothetical protein